MSKRLFIEYSESGARTALMDGGKLREIYIDQNSTTSWVGRIIVGRIKTILPGQFAFVDIGSNKNAFMNLQSGHGLKAGEPVLVQVQKDANRQKGAYVSCDINLKGRLVVLHESPSGEVGVSRKIVNEKENRRLKKLARKLTPNGFGLIIRTNAEGQDEVTINEEIQSLHQLYLQIKNRAEFARPPALLHPLEKSTQLLDDLLNEELKEIYIGGTEDDFNATKNSIKGTLPILEDRIFYHNEERTLFDAHGINNKINRALEKTVTLPCGGVCTFEETEACVVIDVNTASNVGQTSYRETVLQTNLEAAKCIARQLTLRNLSGIILIDFIDMPNSDDKDILMNKFTNFLNNERIKSEIMGMVGLGMVQLVRQKIRPPLSHLLEINCPHCGGKGRIRR